MACENPTVWCIPCKLGYKSDKSLGFHVYDKHHGTPIAELRSTTPPAKSDPPVRDEIKALPANDKPFQCRLCGKPASSLKAVDKHGYAEHKPKGHVRKEWINGQTSVPLNDPKGFPQDLNRAVERGTVTIEPPKAADDLPAHDGYEKRVADFQKVNLNGEPKADVPAPERSRPYGDHTPRTKDAALKFVGLPWMTWPATVAECDETLDMIALALERGNRSLIFFSSLRGYITALRRIHMSTERSNREKTAA
jgi:hypothetical protein